jgi:ribosomal protein RSM22 (predicted rRNA methylase)
MARSIYYFPDLSFTGKLMRMTVPKSQGRQPFYDARKSKWGDMFPHGSKNKLVERFQPVNSGVVTKGTDVGKRRDHGKQEVFSYEKVSADMKERKRKERERRNRSPKSDQLDLIEPFR